MDEDSDSDHLAIVLSIIEGTGFNTRRNAVLIRASLGGSCLETDAAVPGDLATVFKNNLIWSTNKDAIKRMKEDNQPIKLEFFMMSSDSSQTPIGIVLLPIRNIPFWNSRKSGTMKPHWYKLYGVPQDFLNGKPEILLSVSIGDKDEILQENFTMLSPSPRKQTVESAEVEEQTSESDLLHGTSDFNVKLVEANSIEINGIEKDDQHEFIVKIHLKTLEASADEEKMLLIYKLFKKIPVQVAKNVDNSCFIVNESIQLKFKSSLTNLVAYFRDIFHIPIEIVQNNQISGPTDLSFGDSLRILPGSIAEFEQIFAASNFTHQFDHSIPLNEHSNLHYNFSLKYVPNTIDKLPSTPGVIIPTTAVSENYVNEVVNEIPKTFSYNLSLLDCIFNRRPHPGIWQLSLQHPDADMPMVIRNLEISDVVIDQINFEDMNLRLCFSTYPNQLFELIKSKSCIMTLKGPRGVHATAELDNQNILAQEKIKGIVLLENEQNEQVAMAHICVEINELGLNFNAQTNLSAKRQQKQHQAIDFALNEDLAYKKVEELEDWKQLQQKEFLMELKRQEIDHLTRLSNEWQRKRNEQELILNKKMEHCDWLTRALEEAHTALKERSRTDTEYEQKLLQTKNDLERGFAKKMDVLNNKIKQMESEEVLRRQKDMNRLLEIEAERNALKGENVNLKAKVRSLEKELSTQEKNSPTREQLSELLDYVKILSNELEETRKSKLLYKERWAKMVREIQKIKLKNSECGDGVDAGFDEYFRLNDLINSATVELGDD